MSLYRRSDALVPSVRALSDREWHRTMINRTEAGTITRVFPATGTRSGWVIWGAFLGTWSLVVSPGGGLYSYLPPRQMVLGTASIDELVAALGDSVTNKAIVVGAAVSALEPSCVPDAANWVGGLIARIHVGRELPAASGICRPCRG